MPKKKAARRWFQTPEAKAALASLRKRRICVLSTVNEGGQPRSAVVNLTVDKEFRLYFVTQREAEKFRNLAVRREVALNVGFDEDRVDNFQIVGKAAVVKDVKLWASLLKTLVATNAVDTIAQGLPELTAHYPFRAFPARDYAVVAVTPTWIRWFHHPFRKRTPAYTQILGKPV